MTAAVAPPESPAQPPPAAVAPLKSPAQPPPGAAELPTAGPRRR